MYVTPFASSCEQVSGSQVFATQIRFPGQPCAGSHESPELPALQVPSTQERFPGHPVVSVHDVPAYVHFLLREQVRSPVQSPSVLHAPPSADSPELFFEAAFAADDCVPDDGADFNPDGNNDFNWLMIVLLPLFPLPLLLLLLLLFPAPVDGAPGK